MGSDNASGGLGLSQQWELLCPGSRGTPAAMVAPKNQAPALAKRPPAAQHSPLPGAKFQVGQQVVARYFNDWIPARIQAVRSVNGPKGPHLEYDVRLANGKRGLVPEGMLRER